MVASSEDESEPPPSLSAKKRRSMKRSRLSSDSDEDNKMKTRSSTKRKNSSSQEIREDVACGSELNKTPSVSQTPRSSERLRSKSSQSFSLPSREKLLDSMSPKGKRLRSQQKAKVLRPKRLVNNFLRERSSYVSRGEGYHDSDDSEMSDFINDDDDDDEEEDDESSMESDHSFDGNKKDSGVCSVGDKKNHKKKRTVFSSEDEENRQSSEDDNVDDVPLSKMTNTSKKKMAPNAADPNSSESDDNFTPKHKTAIKRRKIIQCSDSDDDNQSAKQEDKLKDLNNESENSESDDALTKDSPHKSASVRPRSRRLQNLTQKQEDKNHKMFSRLLKKRETAKLDPKDRLAKKQFTRDSDESESSDPSSSEDDQDPIKEAAACFAQHSSELEEDDDDRDFIVDDGQTSDEGMNSDGASQFLKLLDTFTGKQQTEEVNGMKNVPYNNENTSFRRRRKRRKKKKERKTSNWRRIKMEDDSSEDNEVNDASDMFNRHPPLHVAVLESDVPLVNKLIKEDPDCVYEIGYRKRTALHLAALEGKVELVKLLLHHGADRTAVDCYHLPAIAYALDGHPECVQLLLDHANIRNISKSMMKNLQEMNLLHFAIGETRDGLDCHNRARCLELLFSKDKKICTKLLVDRDARRFVPLVAAVFAGQHECVQVLMKMGADVFACKTDDGGNILHFALECASHFKSTWQPTKDTSQCLRELLTTKLLIDQPDDHGFTPLMYACESGNAECVELLLGSGASIKCVDSHGTTSLHLAAMSGDTQCVQLLLNFGHQVDCVDRYGWPPLLYANFKAQESCVLALMKPKPEQVFVLGSLLRRARNEIEKKRTVKVVKNVLVSLANHDAYYTVFNDFIRQNPEMLDENNYGLLQHIWRAILDFDNKRRWFLKKLSQIRESVPYSWMRDSLALDIDRENVLGSAMNQMGKVLGHALRKKSLYVTFKNEPGVCTGPKREFFACFCKDVIDPKRGLFIATDDSQYSPVANAYFAKYVNKGTQQDSSQNTASPEVTTIKQEHLSSECTDEELITALSQAEALAVTTADSSAESQLVNSLLSEALPAITADTSADSQSVNNLSSEALAATTADTSADSQSVNNLSSEVVAVTTADTSTSAENQSVNNLSSEVLAATTADAFANSQSVNNLSSEALATSTADTSADSQSVNNLSSEALATSTADTSADSQSVNSLSSEVLAATTADTSTSAESQSVNNLLSEVLAATTADTFANSQSVNNLSSEALAATTVDTSADSQSVNSLLSEAQHVLENNIARQSPEEQISLSERVSGQEGTELVDGETNMETSSQVGSNEQAEESNEITSNSAETCNGASNSNEHDSCGSSNHENITAVPQQQTWISCMEQKSGDQAITNLSLRSKLKQLRFIGRMIGFAICQDLLLDLHLSKPFVKQILGIPLSLPDDLMSFDYELHKNAVVWVRENSINELDLPFSVDALNPWNSKPVTIDLTDDSDKKLTDDNKEEYIKLVSQFKLETSIKDEVAEFSGGLNEVIPREFLSLFTADEFSLLIGGVTKLNVEDWKKHTVYCECSLEDDVIKWFWNVVAQLKEEEKALLMKFSTGSPCVPLGGFAALTGLSGPTKFTILKIGGLNKIPMASTCFNMLKLTSYSSEKHLKDKLLIAIRHGAEGFSFA